MNQTSGLTFATQPGAVPFANPAVTTMLKPSSTNFWMLGMRSLAALGVTNGTSPVMPSVFAAFVAPAYVYSLKFLSSTLPTSVATPILIFVLSVGSVILSPLCAAAPAQGSGGALGAVELPAPPPVQALTTSAPTATASNNFGIR